MTQKLIDVFSLIVLILVLTRMQLDKLNIPKVAVPEPPAQVESNEQNGNSTEYFDTATTYEYNSSNALILPEHESKEGYKFRGYCVNGNTDNLYKSGDVVWIEEDAKTTVTPIYTSKKQITILEGLCGILFSSSLLVVTLLFSYAVKKGNSVQEDWLTYKFGPLHTSWAWYVIIIMMIFIVLGIIISCTENAISEALLKEALSTIH